MWASCIFQVKIVDWVKNSNERSNESNVRWYIYYLTPVYVAFWYIYMFEIKYVSIILHDTLLAYIVPDFPFCMLMGFLLVCFLSLKYVFLLSFRQLHPLHIHIYPYTYKHLHFSFQMNEWVNGLMTSIVIHEIFDPPLHSPFNEKKLKVIKQHVKNEKYERKPCNKCSLVALIAINFPCGHNDFLLQRSSHFALIF